MIWNLYIDATEADLQRDRAALAGVPRQFLPPSGKVQNLDMVDRLVRCFDRPYREVVEACKTSPAPHP